MDANRWSRIRAVFDELVELDREERDKRLRAIGADDPALRSAVETLLAGDAAASKRLEEVELPFLASGRETESDVDLSGRRRDPFGLAGKTLSHFRVVEALGAGGMGVVYRAEDLRLGRPVALKFLLPQLSLDASAKQRFLQEARSAGALDHANLCTIYDVEESGEGGLFLAMPLYAGETLKERLAREGRLPVDDAVEIARQIAAGLACAHAAGIVHRDLKPGNVMLLPNGTVKILDFGLAKVRDLSMTGTGATLGTVSYMAPEQIEGSAVDGRTDLWALGVVLHEMLTGDRPFDFPDAMATARAIVRDRPRRPSELRADLPPELDDVVRSLLRKDPKERCASAGDLLQALRPIHVEVAAPTRPMSNRRKAMLLGIAAVATAVLLVVVGASALREQATASSATRSIAVLPFENSGGAPEDEYFSNGMSEEILATLSEMGGLRVISSLSVVHYRNTTKPVRQIASELRVDHILQGSVERAGDTVIVGVTLLDANRDAPIWTQSYRRPVRDVPAVQAEIAGDIARVLDLEVTPGGIGPVARRTTADFTAQDLLFRGREYYNRIRRDDNEVAIGFFRRALALDTGYVDAVIALADAYRIKGQLGGEQVWKDSAEATARRAILMAPNSGRAYEALGWALNWQDKDDAAVEAYLHAMKLDPTATGGLADVYFHGYGRVDEAVRLFKNALTVNPTDPILNDLTGWSYMTLGLYDEAREFIDRAIMIQPVYPQAYSRRALLALVMRDPNADAHARRVFDVFGESADGLARAGDAAFRVGDLRAARTYYERSLLLSGRLARARSLNLAWIYQKSDEPHRARDLLRGIASAPEWTATYRNGDSFAEEARLRVLEDNRDEAIRVFEIAVQKHWVNYYLLPADPILSSLRGDPTFDRLLAEVRTKLDRQRERVEREGW